VLLLLLGAGYVQPYAGNNAEHVYLPAANHILATGAYNDPGTIVYSSQAPGYSFFLAFVHRISSRWYLSFVVCLQILLDYCTALLLSFLGRGLASPLAGWLAGVLWLVFPAAIVISTWITAETLYTTLFVLSMVIWIRSLSPQAGLGPSLLAGLSLGEATLVRGTTQLLPVFLFAVFFFHRVPKYLAKCALLFAGMCLVILPWTVRNLRMLGRPIVVQTGFGAVFLQGSRSEYFTIEGKSENYPILAREAAQEGLIEPADKTAPSLDRWWFNLGLRNYRLRLHREPLSLFPFVIHKFARLWYGVETGTFYKQLILGLCSLAIVPIAVFQIWVWRRGKPVLCLTLSLVLAYFIVLHVIGYPEFRYMFPLFPILLFAASHQYIRIALKSKLMHPAFVCAEGDADSTSSRPQPRPMP
jgi:4-amino-4-deoxy-L-arabinose transferase-like glycosyltransferase